MFIYKNNYKALVEEKEELLIRYNALEEDYRAMMFRNDDFKKMVSEKISKFNTIITEDGAENDDKLSIIEKSLGYILPNFIEVRNLIEVRESSKIRIKEIYDRTRRDGYVKEIFSQYSEDDSRLLNSYENTIRECNKKLDTIREDKENK